MPYLTKDDLTTHIYAENIDEITRGDDELVTRAINEGLGQVKGYLNRYNVLAMFGNGTTARTFTDDWLDGLAKDIVCWRLIKLANPNIDVAMFRTAYEDAVKELTNVQKGITDPAWPLRVDDPDTNLDESGSISFTSNIRRNNHY